MKKYLYWFFRNRTKVVSKNFYQRREQQEEEFQQLRETYHDKQHKILIEKQQKFLIDYLAKKLTTFEEKWDQTSKQ